MLCICFSVFYCDNLWAFTGNASSIASWDSMLTNRAVWLYDTSKCHCPANVGTSGGLSWFVLSVGGCSPAVVSETLSLMVRHWIVSFGIQNTLTSCLSPRRFHYLTADPESLAMIPMATWHTQTLDQLGRWCEITWQRMLFWLFNISFPFRKVFSDCLLQSPAPCRHTLNFNKSLGFFW